VVVIATGGAIQTIGSYAGLLVVPVLVALALGLRILTRDIGALKRWAGDAPERSRELEARDRRRAAQNRAAARLAGGSRARTPNRTERRG
jgi:hypothetical protein